MTITLHPTFTKTRDGFVPMITARGARGRMLGAHVPKGAEREFKTFTSPQHAISEAYSMALRVTLHPDSIFRVA